MKILTYIVLFISILSIQLKAQNQVELTLNQAVNQAIENNWDVKKMQTKLGVAKAELMQANASFLPNINLSETFINTTDPLNVFGFKLKQEIVSASDFNPSLLNNPDDINNFMTKIQVEQPILNFDALTGRRAASTNVKATELNLTWTKNLIGLYAKQMYFQLQLVTAQKEVLNSTQNAVQEAMKVTQDYFNQNLITKVDLLDMKLRLNEVESQLLALENQVTSINNQFAHFLGYPLTTKIVTTEEIKDLSTTTLDQTTN